MFLWTMIGIIAISFLVLAVVISHTGGMYDELMTSLKENRQKLARRSKKLEKFQETLEGKPDELTEGEVKEIMEEVNKVSKFWKSRRERLRMGFWERMGREHKEEKEARKEREKIAKEKERQRAIEKAKKRRERQKKEEEKEKEEEEKNKLAKLKKRREEIKNLMNKTRVEYRRRKIDETSFREIMRDYQKELMEIEMKISEFKEEES